MKSGKIGEIEKKNMINQNYKEVEKKSEVFLLLI